MERANGAYMKYKGAVRRSVMQIHLSPPNDDSGNKSHLRENEDLETGWLYDDIS